MRIRMYQGIRIRMYQGGLSDSIKTVSELHDWNDFERYCKKYDINIKSIECEHYGGHDYRIGWKDTWIILGWFNNVNVEHRVPIAFSEGNVMDLERRNK